VNFSRDDISFYQDQETSTLKPRALDTSDLDGSKVEIDMVDGQTRKMSHNNFIGSNDVEIDELLSEAVKEF
jgi:hypothetical protein